MTDPADPAPPEIRNRRPDRLTTPAVFLGLAIFWGGVCGYLLFGLPELFPVASGVVGFALGIASCGLAAWALTRDPMYKWALGETLSTWPGRVYIPTSVRRVEIGPDPDEDYTEALNSVPVCHAAVHVRPWGSLRMIVSLGDARRLAAWADRHGIPVRDPGGLCAARGAEGA